MNQIEKNTGMTDEEAEYWDKYFTENPPKVDLKRNRLGKKAIEPIMVDSFSANYISMKAEAEHITPVEVVAEMVRHEMAYA
jgi:hypothetical protein